MKQKAGSMLKIVIMVVMLLSYTMVSYGADTKFVRGTTINGVSVGGLTVEEAHAKINEYYANEYKLGVVREDATAEYIIGSEIGYQASIAGNLQELLDEQNSSGRNSGPAAGNNYTIVMTGAFDEGALARKVQELSCISGDNIKQTSNARISEYQEGKEFKIIPEIQGNSVNVEKATSTIKASLAAGETQAYLYNNGCYDEVTVTSEDEQLKNLCDVMNQCKDMVITYTFGDGITEELSGDVITTWLNGSQDGQILVNREHAAAYVKTLADKYNTAGKTRTFHTATGKDVELTGPYGWTMNQEVEIDSLIGMIRTGQSQSREPQYTKKAVNHTAADWGNTYVEIDLTGQHVYMYQNGTQVWDAPCVTGNVSKNYTTPPGIFSLTYKEKDRILRGKKLADGKYEYESHVDYWMPFNGGIGLHDAKWRSNFGGTIYKNSGSHGCINLPPAKAKILYDLVYTGIPVICYN